MNLDEFNVYYLNNLLHMLSKKNKTDSFLGDFNIDLLKLNQHPSKNEFIHSLSLCMLLPHIT